MYYKAVTESRVQTLRIFRKSQNSECKFIQLIFFILGVVFSVLYLTLMTTILTNETFI